MRHYYPILPILCVLMFVGCASLPDDYSFNQEPPSQWVVEKNNQRLKAIESLIQTGKGNVAKPQADAIIESELTAPQRAQFNLLSAQILLSYGEAEQAVSKLAATQYGELATSDKIKYFQSQAFAYSLTGNLLESAKARIALDAYLLKPVERKKNQAVILETLTLASPTAAQTKQTDLVEWLDIAKVLKARNQNPASFNAELSRWRAANPKHPANFYLATAEKLPEGLGGAPTSVAVLLPESGSYVDAANAIKAGFMATHSRSTNKPILHFYDTEKGKAAELYQQAIKDGAKLVIGPLSKDSIQALAGSTTLSIPVLALNHVPNLSRQNLYQFALSPMDDVAEISKKAALDGHKKVVVLVPENEQSKRVASYFMADWQMLNGTVLKKVSYNPEKADYGQIVKKLLNLDESDSRFQNIAKVVPSVNYVPQKREDVDAVFLSAYSKEGRIINPQLQQLGNISVYAMPTIYSGMPDTANDNALNGITFCDTPWLFNGAYSGELSMAALRATWSQFPSTYIRLVAMGIDAYQLVAKLSSLSTTPYAGATGNLSLDTGNRIKRNLVCAKFAMGQPELIGFTHSPSEGDFSKLGNVAAPMH